MQDSFVELNQKIDTLSAQVAYLTEQARQNERQREDRAELVRDLTPIANQAFHLTIEQLEEIQEYVDLDDLLRLLKRVLRNGRNFELILDQVESLADLSQTVGPLADEAFGKAVMTLTELDQKGYFTFARRGMRALDRAVTSFTEEDMSCLEENIEPIMNFVRNTLNLTADEVGKPSDISMLGLLRQMRDPHVRRGLAVGMQLLRVLGMQSARDPGGMK